jgi:hypothetical protein
MPDEAERLIMKIAEYQKSGGARDADELLEALQTHHAWSAEGARLLIKLAEGYGSFVLSNALAVAIVLEKEDGELGY